MIFLLDQDMATRFRLRLVRPAVQKTLPAPLKDLLRLAWDDSQAKLDLSLVVDHHMGLAHLMYEMESLRLEYQDSQQFEEIMLGIVAAGKKTIVDKVAWLDDDFKHPVQEIKSDTPRRPAVRMPKRRR